MTRLDPSRRVESTRPGPIFEYLFDSTRVTRSHKLNGLPVAYTKVTVTNNQQYIYILISLLSQKLTTSYSSLSIHDFKHILALIVSEHNLPRFLTTKSPALLNSRSISTVVPGIAKKSRAIRASPLGKVPSCTYNVKKDVMTNINSIFKSHKQSNSPSTTPTHPQTTSCRTPPS